MSDTDALFKEVIKTVNLFGLEKRFYDLGKWNGPQAALWLAGQTIYEIYPRAFSAQGSFKAVTDKLPYLAGLGIKIIWLMPVYPIGMKKRKGTLGSPYAVRDYFNLNPELGPANDFKQLVTAAHDLGLKVIMDMVLNHVAPDYEALVKQPNLIKRDLNGRPQRRISAWSDVTDLDYSQKETAAHALSVLKYWLQQFKIDGYRCDVAGLLPLSFWENAARELRKIKNDFFLLAEWESPLLHKKAFNGSYDWSMYFLMRLVREGKKQPALLLRWLQLKSNSYPQNSLPLRFVENHDQPRSAEIFGLRGIRPYLAFVFSVNGLPLLYNGQEIGARHSLSLFENDQIDWMEQNENLFAFYRKLINLRREHPALYSKALITLAAENRQTLVYLKQAEKENILVILNFSEQIVKIKPNFIQWGIKRLTELKPLLSRPKTMLDHAGLRLPAHSAEYYLLCRTK